MSVMYSNCNMLSFNDKPREELTHHKKKNMCLFWPFIIHFTSGNYLKALKGSYYSAVFLSNIELQKLMLCNPDMQQSKSKHRHIGRKKALFILLPGIPPLAANISLPAVFIKSEHSCCAWDSRKFEDKQRGEHFIGFPKILKDDRNGLMPTLLT